MTKQLRHAVPAHLNDAVLGKPERRSPSLSPRRRVYNEARRSMSSVDADMQAAAFSNSSGGHSADVRIRLLVGDASFDLAQVGGGRLIFARPVLLPGGPEGARGEVILSIDGVEQRWAVDLKPQREPSRLVEATFREAEDVTIGGGIHG